MITAYLALFAATFLAATVLPFYSEILFVSLLLKGLDPLSLVLVATTGNTLGSVVNWWLGRYLLHYQDRRWFPMKPHNLHRAQNWFQRFGVWSLLFAWLPIGGDALTFIAGVMRVRLWVFFSLAFVGKGFRFVGLMLLFASGAAPSV